MRKRSTQRWKLKLNLPFKDLNPVPLFPRPGVNPAVKRYGDYDLETGEYVITRPDTPQPWHNYLTNGSFTSYISHTAGGTCFFDDPEHRRVLRTHLHGRPVDQPGRWIYIKDRRSRRHWSASWAPVRADLKKYSYECRVGPGYSIIRSRFDGIATSTTYFVPPDAPAEVWSFVVRNESSRSRALDIFPYAEFILWSQPRDLNLDAAFKCTDVIYEPRRVIHKSLYDFTGDCYGWAPQFAFFAASRTPDSFDVLADAFVGPHNSYAEPQAVLKGSCSNYVTRGGEPCAAFQFAVSLKPGQSRRFDFVVGYAQTHKEARILSSRCTRRAWVDTQFGKLKSRWKAYLSKFVSRTGQPALDVPFNGFSAVQSAMTFLLSRSLSPYQLSGSRGLGFRDSIQDVLGVLPREGRNARELVATLLSVQRPAGDACHTFFPSERRGDGEGCWDDHLWPAIAVAAYVRETGDLAFLKRRIAFWESRERGTVMDHLERAFRFTETHLGKRGLPLLGRADWNDCLNAFPGAESVFTACLYCRAARDAEALCSAMGDRKGTARMRRRYAVMAERINRHAWDGQWYARLILKDGARVGTRNSRYGRIFIESNAWAVMSGVADRKRAVKALDSVRRHLGTPFGFRLCVPPFPFYDKCIGSISVFAPGLKENGSVFCHTNPWVVLAETAIGRGGMAYDTFLRVSPYTKNRIQAVHCAEPYVVNQMIAMPPNLEAGRARNPWLTGTASWLYVAMAEGILGIQPDFRGLRIDPCVPAAWKRFAAERTFRGARFSISIRNPHGVEKGVKSVALDGRPVPGNLIPAQKAGTAHSVTVLMGRG